MRCEFIRKKTKELSVEIASFTVDVDVLLKIAAVAGGKLQSLIVRTMHTGSITKAWQSNYPDGL
jgi:hypothetical protein